jgi:crotonobetainyl-CoA:carnitine CoA-transferase CaiB-like acyl-CoA transferase
VSAALNGVVALETGDSAAAACCTLLLAALGATVLKIEPLEGDRARRLGPFPNGLVDRERSGRFLALNIDKRSVTLDLDCVTGQDLFRSLAGRATVVVESHAPGFLEAREIGYSSLSAEQPALIVASITPFGQSGPYSRLRSSETAVLALSGLLNPRSAGDRPVLTDRPDPFYMAGVHAFAATMTALHLAASSGRGRHLDLSLQDLFLSATGENQARQVTRVAGPSQCRSASGGHAPHLGEHTETVLREMAGLTEGEISELQAAGVA